MSNRIRVKGKDVATAISNGLVELGLRRDQVDVHVVENPTKGFLGFGAKPAIVELQQKRWCSGNLDSQIYMDVPKKKRGGKEGGRDGGKPAGGERRGSRGGRRGNDRTERPERSEARGERNERNERRGGRKSFAKPARMPAREKAPKENEAQLLPCERIQNTVIPEALKSPMAEAKNYLEQVLTHMGVKVENLNAWWDDKQQRILLTFDCDHPAIVIGKEGKTLESIQYLATLAVSRHFDKPISVITDTQNYWRKAEDKIDEEIERGIDMIESGNGVFRFRPMSAQLRRYIHRAVENHPAVATSSEGEGKWRKVTFRPRTEADGCSCACSCAPVEPAETFTACECEHEAPAPAEDSCDCSHCTCGCGASSDTLKTVVELAAAAEMTAAQMEKSQQILNQVNAAVEQHLSQNPETVEQDDAQGGTCQAEIARNCEEGETQVGCSCSVAYETPAQAAEQAPAPQQPAAHQPVESDVQGATCQAEIARNCENGEAQQSNGCACGPLFDAPSEEKK